ncbi:unnamed protein product [Blepharisma stoltei]|uniref:Histidine kinase n=1 Tax=Blepharisma stoltei TaxID=1481888 RepID=A0AAU9JC29_9CILI|nr:unnamed protein product [Blepharisma stoltei]
MNRIKDLWLKEEVEGIYKFLISASKISCLAPIPKIINEILDPTYLTWKFFIPPLLLNVFSLLVIMSLSKRSTFAKMIVLIIANEYHNILFYILSRTQINGAIFEVFGFVLRMKLQFTIIQNTWLFNATLFGHVYLWHIHSYIMYSSIEKPISPILDILTAILLCNVCRYHFMELSYKKFFYQTEVENQKNRLNIITQSLTEGIIILTQTGGIAFNNEKFFELLNTNSENLKNVLSSINYIEGKKISVINRSSKLIDDINYLLSNPTIEELVLGISLTENTNIEWKAKSINWEGESSLFMSIRNANQIIELENNIAKQNLKHLILRSASHELKTPLNSIIYFTNDVLEDKTLDFDERTEKKLKTVLVSGKLMLSLINDLLDYSQILTGGLKIIKKNCHIKEIIMNACDLIQLQAEKKNISIIYRLDPFLPKHIYTDPIRFGQILLNLILNAIRYTIKGKVEVSCVLTSQNKLKCYVEDTGIGINDQKLKVMTDELNSSVMPTIDSTGKGLGLHISNLISMQLGGQALKGKSIPGKGSIFSFTIDLSTSNSDQQFDNPINSDECNEDVNPSFSVSANIFKEIWNQTVLIVDDMEFNLEILGSILKNYGIAYCEAINGKIAIEKVIEHESQQRPIMMDSSMPEMDGWEASRTINQLYRERKINFLPVIIGYSAYNSDEDVKLCFESGMAEFIPKPCSSEEIIKTVIKYI